MSLRPAWRPLRLHIRWTRQIRSIAVPTRDLTGPPQPPPYEALEKCPEPSCACAAMPEMPEGLPIDMKSKMSMPYYDRHVVVAGDVDAQAWPSKLEQDERSVVKRIKDLLGPKGECYRSDFSVSVTASTLPSPGGSDGAAHVYLFPDFVRVNVGLESVGNGEGGFDLKSFGRSVIDDRLFDADRRHAIQAPVVLICGHGQRDQRCGILGPILQAEFGRHLSQVRSGQDTQAAASKPESFVGLVSHIGGHKFAGNVVIYIPPHYQVNGRLNDLAGQTVWYGRVEPKHVEGIVAETIVRGRVITELLRGVHDFGRTRA